MIKSFAHKGLQKFFESGSTASINAQHAPRIRRILTLLNVAKNAQEMNVPGWDFHSLKGDLKGHWAVKVNGPWRITFKIRNGDAEVVDYQQYH
jgi:proteic killer suppression protein